MVIYAKVSRQRHNGRKCQSVFPQSMDVV
jgi:hypothetical protein